MENNKPMVRVHINRVDDIKVTEDEHGVFTISKEVRHMVQWVNDRLTEDMIRSICAMARAEGATDVTILDKEFVVSAIRRAFADKPLMDGGQYRCPRCRDNKSLLGLYCDNCGQKIDWETE